MRKTMLLFTFATLLSLSSFAQWSVGGSVGAVFDRPFMHQNKYDYFYYSGCIVFFRSVTVNNSTDEIIGINYQFDLPILYQFNNRWSFVSGLSFQQKGYRMSTNGGCIVKYNDWYVSLPLMAEFSFIKWKHNEFFVDAGPYIAYWCDSYHKYLVPTMNGIHKDIEKKEFNKDIDNRYECGLIGGVGYKHYFGTRWTCFAKASYQYALTKQFKVPQTLGFLSRNNAFVFQLGLLYNL